MPTNCCECNAPLTGPVCKVCNLVEDRTAEWWKMFIEHWASQGVDRDELRKAVAKFRTAQEELSAALEHSR